MMRMKEGGQQAEPAEEEKGGFGELKARDMSAAEARKVLLLDGPEAEEFQDQGKRDFGHF